MPIYAVKWRKYRIRELLDTRLGLNDSQFAERLGVSRQAFNNAINSRIEPSISLTAAVAAELGVTVDEIIEIDKTRVGVPKGAGRSSGRAAAVMPASLPSVA